MEQNASLAQYDNAKLAKQPLNLALCTSKEKKNQLSDIFKHS